MEARLCYIGHGLMENRSGLIIDARLTRVSGHAERLAALDMMEPRANRPRAITLAADKGYDAADFVEELRTINVRPHVAQNESGRRSAIDKRTTRIPVTPPASASANGSRKPSAGSRPLPDCARPSCAGWLKSTGLSPSPRPPTIWCGRLS